MGDQSDLVVGATFAASGLRFDEEVQQRNPIKVGAGEDYYFIGLEGGLGRRRIIYQSIERSESKLVREGERLGIT